MKRVLLSLLAISACSLLFSQDYQAFRSDREGLYRPLPVNFESRPIRGITVSGLYVADDSVFFFNPTIREPEYQCFTPYGINWLGPQLVVRSNGDNIFRNMRNDTILIRTQAEVGDQWLAYRSLNDSVRVYASMISHDTLTHLTFLDSVKTIQFQATDQDSNAISLPTDYLELKLGKELGLIITPNFAMFPDIVEDYYDQYPHDFPRNYQLLGLTKPTLGLSNLTWQEVFDFQPGDELHVREENRNWHVGAEYHEIIKTIYHYLQRQEQGDSLGYTVEVEEEIWDDYLGTSYTKDTIEAWYLPDPEFDKLPGEPVSQGSLLQSLYLKRIETGTAKGFDIPYFSPAISNGMGNCWEEPWDYFDIREYWQKLGGPYYYIEDFYGFLSSRRDLKYYRKGIETWGTPFLLTSIEVPFGQSTFQVFPNPTSGEITVSAEVAQFRPGFSLILRDIQGRELIRFPLNAPKEQLDLNSWSQGVYLYEIRDEEGFLAKRGKLVLKY